MEYWTILWVTFLGGPFDQQVMFLAYPSLAQCEAAISPVAETLPYDFNIKCEESTTPSASAPPRPRPDYTGN